MEEQPLQFSAMVFESCDKSAGGQNDEDDQEEFVFPFNEENEHAPSGIHIYCSNNMNTQILKIREESLMDDVSLWLHPTPPDIQVCNTPIHYEAPTNITLTVQKELHVKDEVLKGFMDNITRNLKYLGEG